MRGFLLKAILYTLLLLLPFYYIYTFLVCFFSFPLVVGVCFSGQMVREGYGVLVVRGGTRMIFLGLKLVLV